MSKSSDINSVILKGECINEPMIREMPSKKPGAKPGEMYHMFMFKMSWKNYDFSSKETNINQINVKGFGDVAMYFNKFPVKQGDGVTIQGSLYQEKWVNAEDKQMATFVIIAEAISKHKVDYNGYAKTPSNYNSKISVQNSDIQIVQASGNYKNNYNQPKSIGLEPNILS